jgi:ParB family chromosome partitioning protein
MTAIDPISKLQIIPLDEIKRNPENPRVNFRQAELDELTESIRRYGVQVPISVYSEGKGYVLIDGERRWRCSLKLNRESIPALIQPKPKPLTNLLLMFNIHALREQWDLLTIALKLPKIIALLTDENGGRKPTEREMCEHTGLSRAVLRRSKLLVEIPSEFKDDLLQEIHKPKNQQVITEDLYIEMERSLKTVERAMPEVIEDKDAVRRVLINKYKDKTINSVVSLRNIAKIARAENVAGDSRGAQKALKRLFHPNDYSAEQAFKDTVAGAYQERDLETRIDNLIERLPLYDADDVTDGLRIKLERLIQEAKRLLDGGE